MRRFIIGLFVMLLATFANAGLLDMCTEYQTVQLEPTPQIESMAFSSQGSALFSYIETENDMSTLLCEKASNPWSVPGVEWNCVCEEIPFVMSVTPDCFGESVDIHIESMDCLGYVLDLDWHYIAYWDSGTQRYREIASFPDGDLIVAVEKRTLEMWVYISYISDSDTEDSYVYLFKMPLYEFGCAKSSGGYYLK